MASRAIVTVGFTSPRATPSASPSPFSAAGTPFAPHAENSSELCLSPFKSQ
uniref:Uncharacterized protein n=1 Tax=Oryza sativa subsp. japonica TaxID=39947 RepID=Q84ST6_ORYSJ|nr:hypothetical protein Os03g45100 [Oryza sativa Japonica Group]